LVCDMVEKPARVVHMIADWFRENDCQEAMFNLKLPMKQRYAEVRRLLDRIESGLAERGLKVSIGCKQLYHDREEITVLASPLR
ncbi:23S rRNA (cytidine(2498)-2'-O)-methyltransferase RlmM, partial [Escherichia coli]